MGLEVFRFGKSLGYRWTTSHWENGWRNATETRFLSKSTLFRAGKTINWLLKGPRCTHQRCNIIYRLLSRSYFFCRSHRHYRGCQVFFRQHKHGILNLQYFFIMQMYSDRKFHPFPRYVQFVEITVTFLDGGLVLLIVSFTQHCN